MLDRLQKSDFDPYLGKTFTIALGEDETIELELAGAHALSGDTTESVARQPFSLLFRGGPPDRYLPQRIYDLQHPEMGTLTIFLVPLGPDARGMRYEAVFT